LNLGVGFNINLPIYKRLTSGIVINPFAEKAAADKQIRDVQIKTASRDAPASSLSGGNQQKQSASDAGRKRPWKKAFRRIAIMSAEIKTDAQIAEAVQLTATRNRARLGTLLSPDSRRAPRADVDRPRV
jgi:hypothetical protein